MAIFKNNPPIVTDGLVLNIDAANLMSFDSRNLLTNTENFTNGSTFGGWLNLPYGAIVQRTGSAAIAPDGTLSATEVYKEAGSGFRQQSSFGFINVGDTMTFSVYAKAKSGSSSITLDIGDEGNRTWSINDTEWTRCYTTVTYRGQYNPNGYNFVDIFLPLTQSIYLWGSQWNFGQLIDYVPVGSTIPPVKNLADRTITGSLVNRPVYKNDNGGTFRFDGVNDYVIHNELLFPSSSSWTLSQIQYKPSGSYTSWQAFAGNSRYEPITSENTAGYLMWHLSGTSFWWYLDFYNDTTYGVQIPINFSNTIGFNRWYKIDCIYNGDTQIFSLYINGIFYNSSPVTWNTELDSTTMNFTKIANAESRYFEGSIAQTQIYNKSLSPEEITQNYNATKTRFNLT